MTIMAPVSIICSKIFIRKFRISFGSATLQLAGNDTILCIVMDLYSRKVISWHISANGDAELVMTTFGRHTKNEMLLMDWCSIPSGEPSILPLHSDHFWIPWMLCSLFPINAYPFDNACCECFFQISQERRNKPQMLPFLPRIALSTSKGTTIREDCIAHFIWLLQMKQKLCTGNKILSFLIFLFFFVSTYLTIVQRGCIVVVLILLTAPLRIFQLIIQNPYY